MDQALPQTPLDDPAGASAFQHEEPDEDGDDYDDDDGLGGASKKGDKKAGRRKIKIEFIQDKSRRHITFSKRKAGIMKKVRLLRPPNP
jgi:MADS-box transcription factor